MTDGQTDGQTELLYQYRASVCRRAIKTAATIVMKLAQYTDNGSSIFFHILYFSIIFCVQLALRDDLERSYLANQHFKHFTVCEGPVFDVCCALHRLLTWIIIIIIIIIYFNVGYVYQTIFWTKSFHEAMLVSFTGELLQFQRQQHEVVGQQLYIHLDYDSRRSPPPREIFPG